MKRLLILSLLVCTIISKAEVRLGFEGEEAASVGIYVKELATGQVIANNDELRAILPASVMKSVTAASALYTLGSNFRFITPVYLTGTPSEKDSTAWIGNLVIKSCGDPTIDSELFKERTSLSSEIIDALKKRNIKSISGQIVIEQNMPDDGCIPQWEIDDVAWAYGAGLYGFNYRDNYFALWPATGETKPYVPELHLTVKQHDGGTEAVRGINSENLIVYGRDPKNLKWKTHISMNNPAEVFTAELAEKMRLNDISLLGESVESTKEKRKIMEHESPRCVDMLRKMMHESHNLYAEAFLRALAPGESRDSAIASCKSALDKIGVSTKCNRICDGSGLARVDRLQPIFLSDLLESAYKGARGKEYVSLFPRVGKDGTVKGLLEKTSLKGKLALKSGSMSAVQCYAGYKLDDDGTPTHTVVILINSFFCPRAELRGTIEKFLLDTFQPN